MRVNNQKIKTTIEDFFSSKNNFFIPYFQRNYSWITNIQIDMILNDTFYYKNTDLYNKNNHFWGIVVSKKDVDLDKNEKLLIIDGQQRIATFSLIFKTLLKEFSSLLTIEQKNILSIFLKTNENNNKISKIKLKLQMDNNKEDNNVYHAIINDKRSPNISNNLYLAFEHIKEFLKQKLNSKKEVTEYFNRIINTNIVHIILEDKEDNPQNVFESLNSKGMELTIADLIKNYIFMNISSQETQKEYYLNYWKQIENGVKQSDREIANFLRDYMVLKFGNVIDEMNKDLYYEFRNRIKFNDNDIEEKLDDLIYFYHVLIILIIIH